MRNHIKIFHLLYQIKSFLSLLFLLFCMPSFSQNISFSIVNNQTLGCAPFTIALINESDNIGEYTFNWNLGDGGESNNPDVVDAVFNNTGDHSLTLTAFDSNGSVVGTHTETITVYKPVVNFTTTPSTACVGEEISFEASISGLPQGMNIERYIWNFGDGSPIPNTPTPSHSYNLGGEFDVFLQIEDNNNCFSEVFFKEEEVNIIDDFPRNLNILYTPEFPVVCDSVLEVSITNNTAGDYTYEWIFGDDETSTASNPAPHTYRGYGNYILSGSISNYLGCSTIIPRLYISLLEFEYADFSVSDGVKPISEDDTACPGLITFTNITINDIHNEWYINDSLVEDFDRNLQYNFTQGGTYEIKLVSTNGYCDREKIFTLYVEDPINRQVLIDNPYACYLPQQVTYQVNQDIENYDLRWKINNMPYSTPLVQVTFADDIILQDTLWVTSPNMCSDTIILRTVEMRQLSANMIADTTNGCIPLEVNFSDITRYFPSEEQDSIVSWEWHPREDVTEYTTDSLYTYTYTIDGTDTALMIIETAMGCTDTADIIITPGDVPIINFEILDDTICAGQAVTILDHSTDSTKIDYRMISFVSQHNGRGGGSDMAGLGDQILEPVLDADTGCFNLIYEVRYHECKAEPPREFINCAIYVEGPVPWPRVELDCDNPYQRKFIVDSIYDSNSWDWTFDVDEVIEITNTNEDTLLYTYPSNTDYNASFHTSGANGCEYSRDFTVTVRDIQVAMQTDENVCMGNIANFNMAGTQDAEAVFWFAITPSMDSISGLVYDMADPGTHDNLIYHERGTYTVGVIGFDINGCTDTVTTTVNVTAPFARIVKDKSQTCINGTVNFTNNSLTTNSIVSANWETEGTTGTLTGNNVTETFTSVGYNNITLSITDSEGCTDTIRDSVEVITSSADFEVLIPRVCTGYEGEFRITYLNNTQEVGWDFGEGDAIEPVVPDLNETITHRFTADDIDTIKLYSYIYTNRNERCETPVSHTISVRDMSANIVLDRDTLGCYKFDYIFTPKMENFVSDFEWYIAPYGGFESEPLGNFEEPFVQFPEMPGSHKIALVTHSNYRGCEYDTDTVNVYIDGAIADFTVSRDTVCINDVINFRLTRDTFNIYNNNFEWYFGDGNTSTELAPNHHYTFVPTNESFPAVFKVPTCIDVPQKNIVVQKVMADFSFGDFDEDYVDCAPYTVTLKNKSVGADLYQWTFPDGTMSNEKDPEFTFNIPDQMNRVELYVENNSIDCPNSKVRYVQTLPTAETNLNSLYTQCQGDSVLLSATGNFTEFEWIPTTGLLTPDSSTTWVIIDETTQYTFRTISDLSCVGEDTITIRLQEIPEYTGAPINQLLYRLDDDTINVDPHAIEFVKLVANETYNINNDTIDGIVYQWIPDEGLSCSNCPSPDITLDHDQEYTILMQDTSACNYLEEYQLFIQIIKEAKVDIPSAFTPNGDGSNDLLKIRGWGIDSLIYLRIYNRWGQLVYESNNLDAGWDGTFKNKPQPIGTFVYIFEVQDIIGETIRKKGYVDLLR